MAKKHTREDQQNIIDLTPFNASFQFFYAFFVKYILCCTVVCSFIPIILQTPQKLRVVSSTSYFWWLILTWSICNTSPAASVFFYGFIGHAYTFHKSPSLVTGPFKPASLHFLKVGGCSSVSASQLTSVRERVAGVLWNLCVGGRLSPLSPGSSLRLWKVSTSLQSSSRRPRAILQPTLSLSLSEDHRSLFVPGRWIPLRAGILACRPAEAGSYMLMERLYENPT